MPGLRVIERATCAVLVFVSSAGRFAPAQQGPSRATKVPYAQKLTYRIEWRFVTGGMADLQFQRSGANNWEIDLDVQSVGVVTRLYRVVDKYKVVSNEKFCPANAFLDAQEGKRHSITRLTFNENAHTVDYDEHDAIKNTSATKRLQVAPCTREIAGALAALGEINLPAGSSTTVPITDGKRMVFAKVEAQARESINVNGKNYPVTRYEAFLFDNVLYKRKGRLFIWITDDADRLPVQFKIQLGFPIGNISLELEKQQKL
ncbi:MAG: DUF3108 domain-containing protein [Acidobacteriaceae bacterium]|nr:DUF3108 domain-containing protein [Acidobacteriaceae bacterium]